MTFGTSFDAYNKAYQDPKAQLLFVSLLFLIGILFWDRLEEYAYYVITSIFIIIAILIIRLTKAQYFEYKR